MPNALDPDRMTADERLDEVAEILAAGVIRMHIRRHELENTSNSNELRDFPLAFSAHRSVHVCETTPDGETT
jgi:hypothetical protein